LNIKHLGINRTIFEYKKPTGNNWVVFEAMNTDQLFEEQVKIYHIFDFKSLDSLILGRGYHADAKISDISISRVHANLKILNEDIWIQDADSKFGCLFLQKIPFQLRPGNPPLTFQIGRIYFQIRSKKIGCLDKLNQCCIGIPSILEGKDFLKYPEDFPNEIQK